MKSGEFARRVSTGEKVRLVAFFRSEGSPNIWVVQPEGPEWTNPTTFPMLPSHDLTPWSGATSQEPPSGP